MQSVTQSYQLAHDFILQTNRSVFLTGKAGTGKTTFLRNIKSQSLKQTAIVAPTGVAAINAGGTTIHSFFQLPFTPFVPTNAERTNLISRLKMTSTRRRILQDLELLVIDEISMVRCDILDAIDVILRHFRYRPNEPFGGVQLLFIGDMFQLSPVAIENEWRILSEHYRSPYFFHSKVIEQQQPIYIELDKIYRQNDDNFIKVLNEVRNNKLSPESLSILQSKFQPNFKASEKDTHIILTTHNYKADNINAEELNKIPGKIRTFKAIVNGEYSEKSYPADAMLNLKIGAKVMFLRNDKEKERRYYNGKIGTITGFGENSILVKCPNEDNTIPVGIEEWENIRYSNNPDTKQIEEEKIGVFKQYPLRLAWAITIHKSQGLTFEKAIIDAGAAFAPGQVYVALSRCTSLEGLVLLTNINTNSLHVDNNIIQHSSNKIPQEVLHSGLEEAKHTYLLDIIVNLFDFNTLVKRMKRFIYKTEASQASFNQETIPFLYQLDMKIKELQNVATKFHMQLERIIHEHKSYCPQLQERITAACGYYGTHLASLTEFIKTSPAVTEKKTSATEYDEELEILFSELCLKSHIINGIRERFAIDLYFKHKNNFICPSFKVSAYATATKQKISEESTHPQLYNRLRVLRDSICKTLDLPIFMVVSSKTIIELTNYLPQRLEDLNKISGFGKAKIDRFGQEFIDIITEYCEEFNLSSNVSNIPTKKSKKKAKSEDDEAKDNNGKQPTKEISYNLYREGKSIDTIAKERNLTANTIEGHLAHYVSLGEIDLKELVDEQKIKEIHSIISKTQSTALTKIKESASDSISYGDIRLVVAGLKQE